MLIRTPLCACLVLLATSGCARRTVVDLTIQVRTQPYPRPRCGRGPTEAGPVHGGGQPIAEATLLVDPGHRQAQTDAAGEARFFGTTSVGSIEITAAGFRRHRLQAVQLPRRGGTIRAQLQPCLFPGANRTEVGFDRRVTLHARNVCGPDWDGAKLRWMQLEGPDVAASVASWTSRTLTFRTAQLSRTRKLPTRPQLLSFSPDEAGQYVFQLVAVNRSGTRSLGQVLVSSTGVSSGITSVAPNHTYYFAGQPQGPWSWRITDAPKDWDVRLRGAQTRTPSLRIATRGVRKAGNESIDLREQHAGISFSLMIAPWDATPRDCGRSSCHASLQQQWQGSRHGASWKMLLDGIHPLQRGEAGELCASCHSLGHDPGADDGGYDDVAQAHNLTFPPQPAAGHYAELPQPLKDVSNVYCLACHGPARLDPPFGTQPGLFAPGICARCHDRLPEQDTVAQWRGSKHARLPSQLPTDPTELPGCSRCHTAQGFYRSHFALSRPTVGLALTSCCEHSQPISCQACHNAMLSIYPRQLNAYGSFERDDGVTLRDLGAAAVCIYCHSSEHQTGAPATAEQRRAPHAPQTELLYGSGGFGDLVENNRLAASVACASGTPQSCVSCHMRRAGQPGRPELGLGGHSLRMVSPDGREHLAVCRDCHEGLDRFNTLGRADYDGDGRIEGVQDETDGLLYLLERALRGAISALQLSRCGPTAAGGAWIAASQRGQIVIVDGKGLDLGDCDGNGVVERIERPFVVPADQALLYKAAYNYLLIKRDRSRGLHNLPYAIRLLQHTLRALGAPNQPHRWQAYARP